MCVRYLSAHDREELSACGGWAGAMHDVEWCETRAMQHDANITRERERTSGMARDTTIQPPSLLPKSVYFVGGDPLPPRRKRPTLSGVRAYVSRQICTLWAG